MHRPTKWESIKVQKVQKYKNREVQKYKNEKRPKMQKSKIKVKKWKFAKKIEKIQKPKK